ncbi:MAG: invasion associated locus B family protein [Marinosulfonomonas sp.]|nr:invasion associated locus B family protein [Marinosulfonomonas sp.]
MINLIKTVPLLLLATSLMANPIHAQDTSQTGATSDLSVGVPVAAEKTRDGAYVREQHGAWDVRCLTSDDATENCQLYQLLKDEEGNSVAEMTLFALPEGQAALAGATIATPLETLLTAQLTMSVDGKNTKRYPFSYCSVQGCYARVGLRSEDIEAFRKGNAATIAIVPVVAPDQVVNLKLSLSGFTSGFAAIQPAK